MTKMLKIKSLYENKAGKTSPVLTFGIIAIVAIMGILAFNYMQSATSPGEEKGMTGDCNSDPKVDLSVFNADDDKAGTEIDDVSTEVIRNGEYVGSKDLESATFSYEDDLEILVSKDNYLDEKIEVDDLKCGSNSAKAEMYATSKNEFRIFNTNNELLDDDDSDGATTTQSSSSSTISLDTRIDSTTDESTGDLVIVVETDTSEVDSVSLSGFEGVSEYDDEVEFRSDEFSESSIEKAFNVDAVLDGNTASGTISLTPESGETIGDSGTPVYVTAYSKQWFVDTDGTLQYGIEDSNGDDKSEDNWDFDFYVE